MSAALDTHRLLARDAGRNQARRPSKAFYALLAVATLARLALAPLPGYFHDLQLYVTWGALFDRHILDFYSAGAQMVPQPNYPPLTIYLYGLLTWIAGVWCQATGGSCSLSVTHVAVLDAFMKLPTLAAELALTAVIYTLARRSHSERAALGFAAAFAFSPVVLLDGPLWGQIDALSTLGLVLALVMTARGRGLAAGALFGLAVMVKPQPVVFAPLVLVALWRLAGRREALRGVVGMAAGVAAACLPYLLPPRFELLRFWQDTSQIVQALPNSTLSAFNLWWLAGAQQVRFSDPYIGPFSATLVGWALFAAALAYALARFWRDPTPRQLWLGAGMVGVAFFVLTPLQHERYLYPAIALLLVAAIYDRRAWLLYALASLTAFANMVVILLDPVVSASGLDLPAWQTYLRQRPAVASGIAVLNLALLVGCALVLGRRPSDIVVARPGASPSASAADTALAQPATPSGKVGTEADRPGVAAAHSRRPGSGDIPIVATTRAGPAVVPGVAQLPSPPRREGGGEDAGDAPRMGVDEAMKGITDRLRWLWAWITTAEGKQFCSLLALAALVRIIMLPYRGFFDDVQAFVTWGVFFNHHPLLFYSQGAHLRPVPDYPPLAMYLFGLLIALDTGIHGLFGKGTPLSVNYSHLLPALFKLPILLADLALIVVIYAVARRKLSPRAALLASATYAFSPVVFFTGVLWGQIDLIFILLLVLALLAAWKGHGVTAGALFALAVLVKPQPIVFAPLLLIYLWRWQGRREALRAVAAIAVVAFVVCLPYLLPPHIELLAFQRDLAAWERAVPYTSVSAFNLWWLLSVQKLPYTTPLLGPFSPNILGWGLFFVVLTVVLLGVWRSRSPGWLFYAAGLVATAFFLLTPLQHERYLLPAVALLLLAAIFDARHWLFYGLVTLAATLNAVLVVIAPVFSDSKIPYNWAIGRHFLTTHPQVFALLAALNVALLLAMLVVYVRDVLVTTGPTQTAHVEGAFGGLTGSAQGTPVVAAGTVNTAPHQEPADGARTAVTDRRVSIVLPAYNEEMVIAQTVCACLRASERLCPNAEIIVVDDGSRDHTGAIADELAASDPRIVVCHHPANRGYGAALISGFAAARGDLIFFMDSDGQFEIEDLAMLLDVECERPGTVVVGYRRRRQDQFMRKVNAWGWKQVVRLALDLRGIRDVDCAFKLFPAPLVRACGVTSEGAMVNTELLVKLLRMGVVIEQVPVRHLPRMHGSATGANPRVILKAFRELLALRRRLRAWEPAQTQATVPQATVAPPLDEPQPGLMPPALT